MKKKWAICFLWLLVIAVAAMIFYFSAQGGEDSMQTSGGVVTFLLRLFVPGFDGMTDREKMAIYDQLEYLVRKAAHFSEFAMLGASLRLLLHALGLRRPVLLAWAAGTLYACTDELHQMFVDGRGAMWQDVCIDSAGVLAAVLLTTLLLWRHKQRKTKGGNVMQMKDLGFYRGVNLGGWLSQCDYSKERLDGFITEKDIAVIAGWGLDHVRLPLDYNVVQREDGSFIEEGFARIEKALGWCRANGLNVVLDLHKTAGFSFDAGEKEAGFFDSEKYQQRFYSLWEELARRFGGDSAHVAFELLNEVTDEGFIDAWNRISAECIRRIRAIAPDTLILVGSYHNNSAAAVPALAAPADSKVAYNFHCYDPLPFTHQGAYWVPSLDRAARLTFEEAAIPADYFDKDFAPAIQTAEKYGAMLYCGEYGVIDIARPEDTVKWYRQIHAAFEKYGISRCAWSYKQMDFGLSDPRMDGVRQELIRLL